jgi:hypothetical protein
VDGSWDLFFRWVTPPLQPGVVGPLFGIRCMVPKPFAAGGNQPYPKFWAVSGDLRYPGYFILTSIYSSAGTHPNTVRNDGPTRDTCTYTIMLPNIR